MKTKEIVYLIAAVAIFGVVGYLIATQLVPQSSSSSKSAPMVEVVGPIDSALDDSALTQLKSDNNQDFVGKLDLTTGLGNQSVFGQ